MRSFFTETKFVKIMDTSLKIIVTLKSETYGKMVYIY